MKTLINNSVLIFLILFLIRNSHGQIDINSNNLCYHPDSAAAVAPDYCYKPSLTIGQDKYLKILIAYICFADDNYQPAFDNFWQPHQKPVSPTGGPLIASVKGSEGVFFMDRYPNYTISDYFCEMSMGKLDIVGDEVLVNLPETSEYYRTNPATNGYGKMNNYVLQYIHDHNPEIIFSNYDKWGWYAHQQWEMQPDQSVDFVIMAYRFIPNQGNPNYWFWPMGVDASGEATLGQNSGGFQTVWYDGVYLSGYLSPEGAGCTTIGQLQNYSCVTEIIEHEFSHSLFTYNIWGGSSETHTDIGLMTAGTLGTCFNMSPYERSQPVLGWNINPDVITTTSTWLVEDYIKSGRILDIPIPNSSPQEHFWIANHQKTSVYDGISRGGKNCYAINNGRQNPYCGEGKGLFIYHHTASGCSSNNGGKPHDIEQADGKWNWVVDRWVPYYVPGYNFCIPLFEHSSSNPLYGKDEYMQEIEYITNPPACWSGPRGWTQEVNDNPCSEYPNDYFVTMDWWGDGSDGYDMVYDEIFSPYSNPRSNTCANPQNNTGITIRLLNKDMYGNIMVKIYFDDNLALQECPPSKPKNLHVTALEFDPVTHAFHPKLNWAINSEPDFINQGVYAPHYNIYRGNSSKCLLEPSYSLLTTVTNNVTEYVDYSVVLYPQNINYPGCELEWLTYSYKISASDNTNLESLKSDRSLISGLHDPCNNNDKLAILPIVPNSYSISNYPNPFNSRTKIRYTIPSDVFVTIKVFNVLGQVVFTLVNKEFKKAGYYEVRFDGTNLASGLYLYKIEAGPYVQTKKMLLLK